MLHTRKNKILNEKVENSGYSRVCTQHEAPAVWQGSGDTEPHYYSCCDKKPPSSPENKVPLMASLTAFNNCTVQQQH